MYNKEKHKRAPNQYRMLVNPWDLTEGAEKLLELIREFEHHPKLTTRLLGFLAHIPQRKVRKYITELITKKRIKVTPENRKSPGKYGSIKYIVLQFKEDDWFNN